MSALGIYMAASAVAILVILAAGFRAIMATIRGDRSEVCWHGDHRACILPGCECSCHRHAPASAATR